MMRNFVICRNLIKKIIAQMLPDFAWALNLPTFGVKSILSTVQVFGLFWSHCSWAHGSSSRRLRPVLGTKFSSRTDEARPKQCHLVTEAFFSIQCKRTSFFASTLQVPEQRFVSRTGLRCHALRLRCLPPFLNVSYVLQISILKVW
jgi:hypothetical protein